MTDPFIQVQTQFGNLLPLRLTIFSSARHLPTPHSEPEERVNPRHLERSVENQVQEFYNNWMKCFAPNLLPRNKWYRPRENLQEGDLVLETEPTPKENMEDGFSSSTYPGQDGLVRESKNKDCHISLLSSYSQTLPNCNLTGTKQ